MVIQGKSIILKKTEHEDLEKLLTLWNDGRVMKWVNFPEGLGYDIGHMENWFNWVKQSEGTNHFVLYHENEFCGETFYAKDEIGRAGLDIKLFPEYQKKGLAYEAFQSLIKHCFAKEENIIELWVEPATTNEHAIKLYEKCGFKPKMKPLDIDCTDSYWALEKSRWLEGEK